MSRLIARLGASAFLFALLAASGARAERWGANSTQQALAPCAGGVWHNCRGSITLPDGVDYYGDFKSDRPDGFGQFDDHDRQDQLRYSWRAIGAHVGESVAHDGQVDILLPDGAEYIGEFRSGAPNGDGAMITAKGDRYRGKFAGGAANGHGSELRRNGEKYVGEWRGGKRSGHGALIYANGDEYVGDFAADAPTGHGETTLAASAPVEPADDNAQEPADGAKNRFRPAAGVRRLPLAPQIERPPGNAPAATAATATRTAATQTAATASASAPSAAASAVAKDVGGHDGRSKAPVISLLAFLAVGGAGFMFHKRTRKA